MTPNTVTRRFNPLARPAPVEVKPNQPQPTPQPTPQPPPASAIPAAASATCGATRPPLVNLSGIARKKPSGRTDDPVLPDPQGKAAEAAAQIRQLDEELDAVQTALDAHKKFLIALALPHYFTLCANRTWDKAPGLQCGNPGARVRLSFRNTYPLLPDLAAAELLLGDRTGTVFRQAFTLRIDGDLIPAEHAQALITELQALFAKYGATAALSCKEGFKPVNEFHLNRHLWFTPEENLRLNDVCPMQVAVTKVK